MGRTDKPEFRFVPTIPAGRDEHGVFRAAQYERIPNIENLDEHAIRATDERNAEIAAARRCLSNLKNDPELWDAWTRRYGREPVVQDFTRLLGERPTRPNNPEPLTATDLSVFIARQQADKQKELK